MLKFYSDKGMIKQFRIGLPSSSHLRLPIVNGMNYNVDYVLNKVAGTSTNRLKISDTIFSGGKGLTLSSCLAAALGETFERVFGSFIFFETYKDNISGSYNELCNKYNLLNSETYNLFLNSDYNNVAYMCEEFTKHSKLVWIKLKNIMDENKELWIPSQLIYLLYIGKKGES